MKNMWKSLILAESSDLFFQCPPPSKQFLFDDNFDICIQTISAHNLWINVQKLINICVAYKE